MTKKSLGILEDLTIALCQMKVMPGRPDLNSTYIIEEIEAAKNRGVDIIVFPEMCTTGYIVGDIFEDNHFIEDVLRWNKQIIEATYGITVIFGSVICPGGKGEDGRQRKHNAAVIAKNGKVLAERSKTLQPNYRFFNDDKHFYSLRKIAQENYDGLEKFLLPTPIETRKGKILTGVMVCEDMWHKDYTFNPTKILVANGAELIINISASPWTWQKNRKRHQIVKELLQECKVPLIYVNNTGSQNTGKNIIVFDGSSAVYDRKGKIIFEVPPYSEGAHDFIFKAEQNPIMLKSNDTEELYNAMICATKSMVPSNGKVLVGLSGGIDSAVVCAHLVDTLGKERVKAINMPMPFNSRETRDLAQKVAENLGVDYEIIPIDNIVESICRATQAEPDGLTYENVQARARKEILAAKAQKIDGFFVCCSNKTEIALGYGTLYGDIAGLYAPLGDLVKREVRQIADYLNRVRFKRQVIPEICINQIPTAELKANQKDPFDYGDLTHRGYHDEMIRAFTEFRKNPEWFLEMYLKGCLEKELMLEPGTLAKIFPTAKDFINDLCHWWTAFQASFFKRVQCPPIPIFSKRAFGRDLEESIMQPHFTSRYRYLEKYLLSQKKASKQRIAVLGGSFNPSAIHHKIIAEKLSEIFDLVLIVPCGIRVDKPSTTIASSSQRKAMVKMTFQGIPKVEIDFYDLDNNVFTPTYVLQERYQKRFPDSEIWFAIGDDIIKGGGSGASEIHRVWHKGEEIWRNLKFLIVCRPEKRPDSFDLPPASEILEMTEIIGRSTTIRERVARGESISDLVLPKVESYIKEQKLYK